MREELVRRVLCLATEVAEDTGIGEGIEAALAALAGQYLSWAVYVLDVQGAPQAVCSRQFGMALECLYTLRALYEGTAAWESYQAERLQQVIRLLEETKNETMKPQPEFVEEWDNEYIEVLEEGWADTFELREELDEAAEGAA